MAGRVAITVWRVFPGNVPPLHKVISRASARAGSAAAASASAISGRQITPGAHLAASSSSSSMKMRRAAPSRSSNWPRLTTRKTRTAPAGRGQARSGSGTRPFISPSFLSAGHWRPRCIDDPDIASAATSGVTSPAIASGTAIDIIANGEREILFDDALAWPAPRGWPWRPAPGCRPGTRRRRRSAGIARRCGRHRDMARRERRAVVEAIADHQHAAALRCQRHDCGQLGLRDQRRRWPAGPVRAPAAATARRGRPTGCAPAGPDRPAPRPVAAASGRNGSAKWIRTSGAASPTGQRGRPSRSPRSSLGGQV